MKTLEQQDHAEAVKQFSKWLPDAKTSRQSTIIKDFLVEDQTVTLYAQKTKGSAGMTWRIGAIR